MMGRAHNVLYTARRDRRSGAWAFLARGFPQVVRGCSGEIGLAATLALAGLAIGAALAATRPGFERFVLGPEMIDTIDRGEMWTHSMVAVKPLASSGIMTNNLVVAFATYATGVLAGVGTVYLLLLNGVLIGVIGMACYRGGMSLSLWSFVAPHGALEVPALVIAGGAGLALARGVLFPGTLPRRDAMARAGARSVRLILGVVPLLVIAGVIEGFVSPTPLAPPLKFTMGAALLLLLVIYLVAGGRESPVTAHSSP